MAAGASPRCSTRREHPSQDLATKCLPDDKERAIRQRSTQRRVLDDLAAGARIDVLDGWEDRSWLDLNIIGSRASSAAGFRSVGVGLESLAMAFAGTLAWLAVRHVS
jgi:hypothetical protein